MNRMTGALAVTVERAGEEHLDEIAAIAADWRTADRDEKDLSQRGFLFPDRDRAGYATLLGLSDYCYVAKHDNRVVGFLFAYSDQRVHEADDFVADRVSRKLDSLVMIDQFAVAKDMIRQGISTRLYEHLIGATRGRRLVASVVATPPNVAAQQFHRDFGFLPVLELKGPPHRWADPRHLALQQRPGGRRGAQRPVPRGGRALPARRHAELGQATELPLHHGRHQCRRRLSDPERPARHRLGTAEHLAGHYPRCAPLVC